jgi:hypothetical protein
MKNTVTFSAFPSFAALLLVACDSSSPEIVFEPALPKPPPDLMALAGEAFRMRQGQYTLRYRLSTDRKPAFTTTASEGDTQAFDRAAHFRGVYHFSPPQKDGSFYRYAVKIRNNFIYDLNSCLAQRYLVAQRIS